MSIKNTPKYEVNGYESYAAELFYCRYIQGLTVNYDSNLLRYCVSPMDARRDDMPAGTMLYGHLTANTLPVLTRVEPPV